MATVLTVFLALNVLAWLLLVLRGVIFLVFVPGRQDDGKRDLYRCLPLIPVIWVVYTIISAPAFAQSLDTIELARNLGTILGSEAACGFQYDQSAVAAWVDQHVSPSDMSFPSTLSGMSNLTEFEIGGMGDGQKTAHCRAVENTARHLGFLR